MHFLTKSLEERPINRSLRAQASTNHRNDTLGIAVLHQEVGRCVTEELAHRLDALHDRLSKPKNSSSSSRVMPFHSELNWAGETLARGSLRNFTGMPA